MALTAERHSKVEGACVKLGRVIRFEFPNLSLSGANTGANPKSNLDSAIASVMS